MADYLVSEGVATREELDLISAQLFAEIDASVRLKMVTLPNGYGLKYKNGAPNGPQLNLLTPSDNCEPLTKTPFHKHLPVKLRKA